MYKIDLHTHSIVSQDGGIAYEQYRQIIESKQLDYIAVTDHNSIEAGVKLRAELGDRIIIGEEILSSEGEIIGLFLSQRIAPGLTALETIREIKQQGGLVYIPHPFETHRKGVSPQVFQAIKNHVNIIELFNARAKFRGRENLAMQQVESQPSLQQSPQQPPQQHIGNPSPNLVGASSSDAHCKYGIGSAYTLISEKPTQQNLVQRLQFAEFVKRHAPLISYLCPTINRIKKYVH